MYESNHYFHDGQYFFASTSSKPYKTILTLNTISKLNDENLIYNGQTSSTSMSSQILFYETISTSNTVAELDDKSLIHDG
ncbi:hypothetical protein F8M41_020851 [Gigaspora margarita]|uniref:Uncharacterized protein n=1 Tax=Gigaspora margarita TaxID=4874 RepID=A0A8H4AHT2_GIGMA|nr:hypothetical protein F8M41_020851 [Gigaspora margarita]